METIEKYTKRVGKMSVDEIHDDLANILDVDSTGIARAIHLDGDDYIDLRVLNIELQNRGLENPYKW
jgi:hypothetical protein